MFILGYNAVYGAHHTKRTSPQATTQVVRDLESRATPRLPLLRLSCRSAGDLHCNARDTRTGSLFWLIMGPAPGSTANVLLHGESVPLTRVQHTVLRTVSQAICNLRTRETGAGRCCLSGHLRLRSTCSDHCRRKGTPVGHRYQRCTGSSVSFLDTWAMNAAYAVGGQTKA